MNQRRELPMNQMNLVAARGPARLDAPPSPYPALTREVAENIRMRQRPGGLACLPDPDLQEANEPEAVERYIQTLRAIAKRYGGEVWGLAHVPRQRTFWRYRQVLFEVTHATKQPRRIPIVTYHRIESVLAAGFRVHAWLWADEVDASLDPSSAFPSSSYRGSAASSAPERSLGWLDPVHEDVPPHLLPFRPNRLIPPFEPIIPQPTVSRPTVTPAPKKQPRRTWLSSLRGDTQREARREAWREAWRDPMVVSATWLGDIGNSRDVVLLTILGKWLEPH